MSPIGSQFLADISILNSYIFYLLIAFLLKIITRLGASLQHSYIYSLENLGVCMCDVFAARRFDNKAKTEVTIAKRMRAEADDQGLK